MQPYKLQKNSQHSICCMLVVRIGKEKTCILCSF